MRDPVRSVYECEATHGSYSRCTLVEGHKGPHHNDSYTWEDPKIAAINTMPMQDFHTLVQTALNRMMPKEGEPSGGTSSVVEPEGQKAEGNGKS